MSKEETEARPTSEVPPTTQRCDVCVCVWGAANEPPTERMIVTVYLMNMNLRSLRSIRLGPLVVCKSHHHG